MARMTRYFETATRVLLDHDATVDKYMGDAVMAFWNAPVPVDGHVARACEAALALRDALRPETAGWTLADGTAVQTRIGLHAGPAIVGNVGSSDRMNYTALGSTVNLARRVETLTRAFDAEILVSADTVARAGDGFTFRPVGQTTAKGFRHPVELFELVGSTG